MKSDIPTRHPIPQHTRPHAPRQRLLPAVILALLITTAPSLQAREVRAIHLPANAGQLKNAHLIGAATSFEIELPQRNLSSPVRIPNGELLLAALAAPPGEAGEIPAGAPKVRIPEDWSRCILIFLGDTRNTVLPVRIIPVDASSARFPKGSTYVFNLSNSTLQGQFGNQRVRVESGKTAMFNAPLREFGSYPMGIDCLIPGEAAPRAISRTYWQHDPDARQLLFVTPQEGNPLPRVWGILDREEDREEDREDTR